MKIFVAGATGFTGRAMAQLPKVSNLELVLGVRSIVKAKTLLGDDERIVEVDYRTSSSLKDALSNCDACIQLIGTVRKKFDAATSYESVDYQTTVDLIEACQQNDAFKHFVLVSSVGAGMGIGSYLSWKKRTEEVVRDSGLPYTIFRPGMIVGAPNFKERAELKTLSAFLHGLSETPFGGPAADVRPMSNVLLAQLLLNRVQKEAKNKTLRGRGLWTIARKEGLSGAIKNHSLFDGVRFDS